MSLILSLILLPLLGAFTVYIVRNNTARKLLIRAFVVAIAGLSIFVVFKHFNDGFSLSIANKQIETIIDYVILGFEILISAYIFVITIRDKKYLITSFVVVQMGLLLWFEFTQKHNIEVKTSLFFDKFTAIMILIIGVIGSLIVLYAVGYMKWYHIHHKEYKERNSYFFFLLFLFLSAMFGIVLSNNLSWMFFAWEITTLCSFLLIGYTKTEQAKQNSYRALTFNMGGGLAFAAAIVIIGINLKTIELSTLIKSASSPVLMFAVLLLSIAAMTKAAQMPFHSWLLGAMVAPTPTSALLHSATMVKAGVFLLIRISPLLGNNLVGKAVTLISAVTFLITSLIAISQSDAKKILAYSTIANLGLIITCASIGTMESLWGAILLLVFHSVSKSLLFLTVGSIEHQIGSRNVEDMDVLLGVSKKLTLYMIIGIAGMFLAPFGMLISKWVAMKAFIDSDNILIVILVIFGSSATLFYWTKWMGKLFSNSSFEETKRHTFRLDEHIPIFLQASLTLVACFAFPVISKYAIVPFLSGLFGAASLAPIAKGDVIIMIIMMSMLVILPISFIPIYKADKRRKPPIYMAGENTGDNANFKGALGDERKIKLSNWYMEKYFGNQKLIYWSNTFVTTIFVVIGALVVWGMFK